MILVSVGDSQNNIRWIWKETVFGSGEPTFNYS